MVGVKVLVKVLVNVLVKVGVKVLVKVGVGVLATVLVGVGVGVGVVQETSNANALTQKKSLSKSPQFGRALPIHQLTAVDPAPTT